MEGFLKSVSCYKKHGLRGLTHQQIYETTLSISYFLAKCNIHWLITQGFAQFPRLADPFP